MASLLARFVHRLGKPENRNARESMYSPAPGTRIRYSPSLLDDLRGEHEQLFALHGAIMAAHAAKSVSTIAPLLKEFEALLNGHMITERVHLYAYMDGFFSHDDSTRRMVRDYRIEMDRIGDSVAKLLRKYRDADPDSLLLCGFHSDLEYIGQLLSERIRREDDSLYPLYMPIRV
jgi:hypothetical protein